MFGGRRKDDGKVVFKPTDGVLLDRLLEDPNKVGPSPLLDEAEMEFYADEYMRNGLRGPLCWYKTGRINFEEELELLKRGKTRVTMPALYIGATRDVVLPPWMMANMGKYFDDLTTREVDATHWALWEAAEDVNKHLTEFVERVLGPPRLKASI
jgi:soluble epoxide hydrolase/lipid-phosphate phosphatase